MGLDVYIHFLRFCINDSLLVICRLQFTDIYENSNRPLQLTPGHPKYKYERISFLNCSRAYVGVSLDDNNGQEIHSQRGMMVLHSLYLHAHGFYHSGNMPGCKGASM